MNPRLLNGKEVLPIDLSSTGDLYYSGEALVNCEYTTFNNQPAIKVNCNYNASKQTWEEISTQIDVQNLDIQNYKNLSYEIYFDYVPDNFTCKYGGAITGVFDFQAKVAELVDLTHTYSKTVIEGKDTTDYLNQITGIMDLFKTNIPKYSDDPALIEASSNLLKQVVGQFDSIIEQDEKMAALKAENKVLMEELVALCDSIKADAKNASITELMTNRIFILIVLVGTTAALTLFILSLLRSMSKSMNSFKSSLEQMANGNLSVRVEQNRQDEFSLFGNSINQFLDKLQGIIEKLQQMALTLTSSGDELDVKASQTKQAADLITDAISEISTGAMEQAGDIENSSTQVAAMCTNMDSIVEKVNQLFDTINSITEKSSNASNIMNELCNSNDATTKAFEQIAEQIHKTDDSVTKIQDAVNLIASIASQTNLLSLNASIEASRAGDAGKGFAVVASEIQKLAEQTNSSANIINQIILTLSGESQKTVQSIQDVTTMIYEQRKKLDHTKECFTTVSSEIASTEAEMSHVLAHATSCGKSGQSVADLMTNLSAIAEENAASAEHTTASMSELNNTTLSLADTAQELKKFSESIHNDLNYFTTSGNSK